jgi:quercetin dioxygenase-like cupin family protein
MKASSILRVENERVIVTEWRFEPGAETGHHVHALEYIVVPLTDGTLQIGSLETQLRAGEAYARPAGVAHNVVNAGPREFRFVEVELKPAIFPPTPEGDLS